MKKFVGVFIVLLICFVPSIIVFASGVDANVAEISATVAPVENVPALKIKCIDVDNPSEPLFVQQYVYLDYSEQIIYAPDLSGYTLIDQTPQVIRPANFYTEVVFNYKNGRVPNATPLPIEPLSESTPEPWVSPQPPEYYNGDLTVVCVDKDNLDKVLYRQTIKNMIKIGIAEQTISVPELEGYVYNGGKQLHHRFSSRYSTLQIKYLKNDISNYIYDIKNLSILTESGETLTATPQNKSFIAEVEVNKKTESDSKDYIFVAVYDKNGALLNIDYVKAKFAVGECSFGFNVPATSSEIGSIKAFVWSDFNSAQPLAEPKIINLN